MGARKAEPQPHEEHLPGERLAPFVTCFWEVTPGRATVVGVRFRPGAAPSLLGLATRELLDDAATVEDVWGPGGRALDERLAAAPSARSAMSILRGELEARAAGAPAPDERVSGAEGRPVR